MEPRQSPWLVAAIEMKKDLANQPAEVQEAQRQLDRPHYPRSADEKDATSAKAIAHENLI